jgi:hypothetical protein
LPSRGRRDGGGEPWQTIFRGRCCFHLGEQEAALAAPVPTASGQAQSPPKVSLRWALFVSFGSLGGGDCRLHSTRSNSRPRPPCPLACSTLMVRGTRQRWYALALSHCGERHHSRSDDSALVTLPRAQTFELGLMGPRALAVFDGVPFRMDLTQVRPTAR